MALTVGSGPFSKRTTGSFNIEYDDPGHVLWFEDSPRRVRVELGGVIVAESSRMKLLHETGILPVYYFPRADVDTRLLDASDHTTHCPFKGEASYQHVVAGGERAENALWYYPSPKPEAQWLLDHVAFYWNRMDAWYEEDERIFVHARDPYHRVDVLPSRRHVRVFDGETLLAESERPMVLFESGLPPRYYFAKDEVRFEGLAESHTETACPYKGTTSGYWSARRDGGELHADIAWCYDAPIPAVGRIAGRVAFYDEKLDVEVDGVRQERPVTRLAGGGT